MCSILCSHLSFPIRDCAWNPLQRTSTGNSQPQHLLSLQSAMRSKYMGVFCLCVSLQFCSHGTVSFETCILSHRMFLQTLACVYLTSSPLHLYFDRLWGCWTLRSVVASLVSAHKDCPKGSFPFDPAYRRLFLAATSLSTITILPSCHPVALPDRHWFPSVKEYTYRRWISAKWQLGTRFEPVILP